MMRRQVLAAVRVLFVLSLVLGVLYPAAVTVVAWATMPGRAGGSLVEVDGRVVGSALVGQEFSGLEWFHGRPDPFDPAASGPSNLGPSNEVLAQMVGEAADAVRRAEGARGPLPVDAVTGSGSGLDPHISPEYALLQVPRVAAARGLPEDEVAALVAGLVEGRTFGFLGERRVNVLALNLSLESLQR